MLAKMVAELFADTFGVHFGGSEINESAENRHGSVRAQRDQDFVQNGVDNHNIAVTGNAPYYPVGFYVMDTDGSVLGGLMGQIWARWLHVGTLWVDERVRGRGHASRLMETAERYAIEKGCTDSFLETFSFQARPFYEKLGYRVFGTLENYPEGHSYYYLTKHLDASKTKRARVKKS
jgi:ribosomal protein S18 acetylase RimI-like enzyme